VPGPGLPRPSVGPAELIYGVHAVAAAWLNPARRRHRLYATRAALDGFAEVLARAREAGLDRPAPIVAEREAIDRLPPPGAVHQGLVLDAGPLPEMNLDDMLIAAGDGPAILVMLDQVTDPHNVGAILRSAAAFGALGMIVQTRHAPEVTGVLAKAASGGLELVPIVRETNLARAIDQLRDAGFDVVGLAEGAPAPIADIALSERVALVLGAEGAGLRRLVAEKCTWTASLPTRPPVGSLNVSNAAAVALYDIARRSSRRVPS
jgi:23S rRNA (guanosine2251-2'-O)-methyltransferase